MAGATPKLAEILELVRQLAPDEQARLAEQIELGLPESEPLESLEGLWVEGRPMPSLEEMQAARRELWSGLDDPELA